MSSADAGLPLLQVITAKLPSRPRAKAKDNLTLLLSLRKVFYFLYKHSSRARTDELLLCIVCSHSRSDYRGGC